MLLSRMLCLDSKSVYRTERLDLRLAARVQQLWYSRLSYLDELDQYYTGSVQYALTPSLSVNGRAGYTVDSQPDRDILETGLRRTTAKRQNQAYGASGNYTINEKMSTSLSYDYSKDTYFDQVLNLNDMESNVVNLGFTRNLGTFGPGLLTGRLNVGYRRYLDANSTVDGYWATVGLSSTFHEKWSFLIDAGARRTDTKYTIPTLFIPGLGATGKNAAGLGRGIERYTFVHCALRHCNTGP